MRSRPRTVIRSAAPGPAPMKCTVIVRLSAVAPKRPGAQVAAPTTSRGPMSRAAGPAAASAAASATDGTPASASTRSDRVCRAVRRGLADPRPRPRMTETPSSAAAARRCPASSRFAVDRGDDVECAGSRSWRAPAPRGRRLRYRPPARRVGIRRRRRSWLHPHPLRDRHRRAPAGLAADRHRRAQSRCG